MNEAAWVSAADRALSSASDQIRVIRAVTPTNGAEQLEILGQAFRRGAPRFPEWRYEFCEGRPELTSALSRLADFLDTVSPLGAVYAARARELCLEADIIGAVGTPALVGLAKRRFLGASELDQTDLAKADALAEEWTRRDAQPSPNLRDFDRDPTGEGERVRSCDLVDPRSLVSTMSRAAGREKLAMRVLVQPGLASLAATADGAILVAQNQWLSPRDTERTVLHEIAGHALPRARALGAPLGIFGFGTARGVDDQEGRALAIEESAGFLDGGRRRELGLRHLAARRCLDGADFVEVIRGLLELGAAVEVAVRIASRVLRGGGGGERARFQGGGLAREVVYLPAFVRVARVLGARDAGTRIIERTMASGRIAAEVALVVGRAAGFASRVDPPLDVRG